MQEFLLLSFEYLLLSFQAAFLFSDSSRFLRVELFLSCGSGLEATVHPQILLGILVYL